MRSLRSATAEVDLIVSAVPTPVLIADYSPIIERFSGKTPDQVRYLLTSDDKVFTETLCLPRAIAASPEWVRLYGSPLTSDLPDLESRHFTREKYRELDNALVRQFTAPFDGTTSIISEHTAPTLMGDVIVRSHWRVLEDDHGPMWDRVVIVDFDVSDLRKAERELRKLLVEKDDLVRLKDRLIASVAHEMRTPLSSIVGFAELLREAANFGPEEHQEMVEMVARESADLTSIVEDLMVAAKSNLGRLEVSRVSVDLKAQAAQAIESIDLTEGRSINLSDELVRCVGDPARVRQIIRNLVSNAIKYGGPEISIEASMSGVTGSLAVRDNGSEIREDLRERIFEAYQRGDQASSGNSLGLGLHISRSLARHMGGDLTYRHQDGWNIFELTLPLVDTSSHTP